MIKLGGSLARSTGVASWLDVIRACGVGQVVVVPGGGAFADRFDACTAHRMALLAMEQFGLMLCGLRSGLVPADSCATIFSACARGEVPVWMPSTMALADPSIPQSWEVTSDSLAAWLAAQLDATMLVVVKSMHVHDPRIPVDELISRGWVDSGFARFMAGTQFQLRTLGQGNEDLLRRVLLSP